MTIYHVVYDNQFGEEVADFGFYVDELDAEKRAVEIRMKAPLESGKVRIEEVFVHDSSRAEENKDDRTFIPYRLRDL